MTEKAWEGVFNMPVAGRSMKPREDGFTMVLDKGLGLNAVEDLMTSASDYIDFLKLSFGTSAFYNKSTLREKIDLTKSCGVDVCPGGTFLEVAVWQGRYKEYLTRAKELGFTAVEVSDGTIDMDKTVRADCIERALDAGFKVLTEVGKKSPEDVLAATEMHSLIEHDLEFGAMLVIIEAREGGKGIGVFDGSGAVQEDEVDQVASGVQDLGKVMWEAPIKNQQQYMILRFGSNVSLGNIPTTDVMALEALRQGLRGDTLKRAYLAD